MKKKKGNIKKQSKRLKVPRSVAIVVAKLGMRFQPNTGSSLYKRPSKGRILLGQESWTSPVGTLRLSDHWNYENKYNDKVYKTSKPIAPQCWVICINTNIGEKPWKVLVTFDFNKSNLLEKINFQKIQEEIKNLLGGRG